MTKGLRAGVVLLLLAATVIGALTACSFGGSGDGAIENGTTVNRIYIVKKSDFSELSRNIFVSERSEETKEEYTVPSVDELTIGEEYYIVAYTYASTKDGSEIMYAENTSLSIKTADGTPIGDVLTTVDIGYYTADNSSARINDPDDKSERLEYPVWASAYGGASTGEFFYYVEVEALAETKLDIEYYMNATVKKKIFGAGTTAKKTANAYYPKKVELSNMSVLYLDGANYVDGSYEDTALVGSVDMKVGKYYYMVITAKIKSLLTESAGEQATFSLTLSPRSLIDGTLEFSGSGNLKESVTETEKNISISFKIPEPEEGDKVFKFIIKLTPVSLGSPKVSFGFSADKISVVGNENIESTLLINGEEKVSEGFEYQLSADKSYYILTDLDKAKGSHLLVPAQYNGLPVKEIAENAFRGYPTLKSIEVSEGIERIGSYAFQNCTNLLWVKFPSTATVGQNVLSGCKSVTTLNVNLSNIQLYKLFGSSGSSIPATLKTVTLVGDTSITDNAFQGGSKIENLSLPASLTSISGTAFSGCTGLKTLTLDSQCQSFFMQCGILYETGSNAILAHLNKFSGELTYPAGLTSIPGGDMTEVTKITVPITATKFSSAVSGYTPREAIGPAFVFTSMSNKSKLERATVTAGTSMPSFSGAANLTHITVSATGITSIGGFSGCKKLKTVTLSDGVQVINSSAFLNCESLAEITIPSTVQSIDSSAFKGCKSLGAVTIPSGIELITTSLFEDCSSLTSVSIPSSVTVIQDYVFRGCSSLKTVSIPSAVYSLGWNVFSGSGITSLHLPAAMRAMSDPFKGAKSLTAITVDSANEKYYAVDGLLYRINDDGKVYLDKVPEGKTGKVTVDSRVKSIWDFEGCDKITEVVIPSSVGAIRYGAFKDCTSLKSVTVQGTSYVKLYSNSHSYTGSISLGSPAKNAEYFTSKYVDKSFVFDESCLNLIK